MATRIYFTSNLILLQCTNYATLHRLNPILLQCTVSLYLSSRIRIWNIELNIYFISYSISVGGSALLWDEVLYFPSRPVYSPIMIHNPRGILTLEVWVLNLLYTYGTCFLFLLNQCFWRFWVVDRIYLYSKSQRKSAKCFLLFCFSLFY